MSGAAQNPGANPQVHSDDVQSSTKSAHTTTSTDNGAAAAGEGGSGENAQGAEGDSERQAGSPEPNCAICLGQLENKSFTDSCFHMFCFVCLQEWSKIKAECPLCKQPFKSIIHNVKSYNNYDQFYLDHQQRPAQPLHFGWNFDRSFRYRTTLTMDHRYFHLATREPSAPMFHRSVVPRYRLRSRTVQPLLRSYAQPVSTTGFRRQIYETGRRVSGLRATHRRRRASPEFFRANPAQMHRLVPWLNRELNALLYSVEEQVTFVLELILGLVKRFRIDSEEFYEHIHPFLHHNTRHFMHEFLYFARSPYAMHTYDTKVIYEEPSHLVSASESSTTDSDVVVVDDDDEPGVAGAQQRFRMAGTLSPWHSPQTSGVPCSTSALARSRWDSPTPGPSWDMSGNSSHSPVNVDDSSDSDASTIIDPAYITTEASTSRSARAPSPDTSDGEEVIFLSYDKPWEERSPIQLSSGSDSETSSFIKALKQENNRKKKGRSSPAVLDPNPPNREGPQDGSSALTAPAVHHARPHHSSSSTLDLHGSSTSAISKSRQDRHHKKRRHRERSKDSHHSSRSSHREKHKSSHSHSSVPAKKRRHNDGEDGDAVESSSSHKKHKHKKHKKNKERKDKHSKRRSDGHQSGATQGTSEGSATPVSAERADHCKKHPSGHKKSRVKNISDGRDAEAKDASSGHHSDGLLSDTSTSSGNNTATTTSLADTESSSTTYFSRQQRVQQVLQQRRGQNCLPLVSGLIDMDMVPSWENISRLASVLASHATSPFPAVPGPSQSSSDPVVISTSEEDSDVEACPRKGGEDHVTSDNMPVAKTVVVPCSSNPEVPTAAIEYAGMSASTTTPRLAMVDNYIDVESISSEEEMEVVDVESVEDTDSSTDPGPEESKRASAYGSKVSAAESEGDVSLANTTDLSSSKPNASDGSNGVLETKAESADVTSFSEVSREVNKFPIAAALQPGVEENSTASAGTNPPNTILHDVRTLSPISVAVLKHKKTSKPFRPHSSSAAFDHPFSMRYILNKDVFMGSGCSADPQPRQPPTLQSSLDSPLSGQDFAHSQPQSSEDVSGPEHANQQPFRFSVLEHLQSRPQERTVPRPLPSTDSQDPTDSRLLSPGSQHSTENPSLPFTASQCSRQSQSPSPVSQRCTESPSEYLCGDLKQTPEGQESRDRDKLTDEKMKMSDEEVENVAEKDCSESTPCNLILAEEDSGMGSIAGCKQSEQESAFSVENRESVALNDSVDKRFGGTDATDVQNNMRESTDDTKGGIEDTLNDSFSTDLDDEEEKFLLTEDVNSAVASDPENDPPTCISTSKVNSEATVGVVSEDDQSCSNSIPAGDCAAEYGDTCADSAKVAAITNGDLSLTERLIFQEKQNGIGPDEKSLDMFENNVNQEVSSLTEDRPGKLNSILECQADSSKLKKAKQ